MASGGGPGTSVGCWDTFWIISWFLAVFQVVGLENSRGGSIKTYIFKTKISSGFVEMEATHRHQVCDMNCKKLQLQKVVLPEVAMKQVLFFKPF